MQTLHRRFKEPYIDKRYHPQKQFGIFPSGVTLPKCPKCKSRVNVVFRSKATVDGDAVFHPTIFVCGLCGLEFK